jgi:hypothetical protein
MRDAGGGAPAAPVPPAAAESGLVVRASGLDYRRDTAWSAAAAEPGLGAQDTTTDRKSAQLTIPPELARLNDPSARQDCLNLITRLYGGRPQSVDYARFEGSPALIIVYTDELSGRPVRLVAAGPNCGLNGDPALRIAVPVS